MPPLPPMARRTSNGAYQACCLSSFWRRRRCQTQVATLFYSATRSGNGVSDRLGMFLRHAPFARTGDSSPNLGGNVPGHPGPSLHSPFAEPSSVPSPLSMPAFIMIIHLFLALLHRPSLSYSLSLILILVLLLHRLRPFPPPLLPCTPSGSSFELGGTVPHPLFLLSVLLLCYPRLHPPSSVSSYAVPLAVSFPRPSFVPFRRVAPNPLPPLAPSPLPFLPFRILPVIAHTHPPPLEKLRELDGARLRGERWARALPRPPLEHSGKSLGYFYASTVLLHDNRNYSVLFNPNTDLSRLRLRRSDASFLRNRTFVALLAAFLASVCAAPLTPLSTGPHATLRPSFPTVCDPAALQLGANTPLNNRMPCDRGQGYCRLPHRVCPLRSPVRRNRPRQQISDTYKRRDWEPCSSSNGGKGTIATLAADKNGQAVGPRATCDIKACVIALEPSFPLCVPAVMKLGADNSFNAACLAAAAKGTAAFPSACAGCAAQFGVTDPGASATAAGVAIN
ncbi:hypothetical protein B0H14DRAFT_3457279 [Mycena olivaceomarginata]|nr:hypothetical protein B0H14DRAFT_3457279 [Mycena olivaceomarginata]